MSASQLPIKSESTLVELYNALHNINPAYSIMARLIVETGCPFNQLSTYTKSDLNGKTELSYEPSIPGHVYTHKLSKETQSALSVYLKGLKNNDLAFSGVLSGKPVSHTAFRKGLSSASKAIGLSDAVTYKALRRTFIYRIAVEDGDYKRAMALIGTTSKKRIVSYIGALPDVSEASTIDNEIANLDKNNIFQLLDDSYAKTMKRVHYVLHHRDKFDTDTVVAALRTLQRIDTALDYWRQKDPKTKK